MRPSMLLALVAGLCASDAPPPFPAEVTGDWHVYSAHLAGGDIAQSRPGALGSVVRITATALRWADPAAPDAPPWLEAECRRAEPEPPLEPGAKATGPRQDPNQLVSVVNGSLCAEQGAELGARWRIVDADHGVLHAVVGVKAFTGKTGGGYSASPGTVLFVLGREALPPALAPDPAADATRILGTWEVLAEFDDASTGRTRGDGHALITTERIEKRDGRGTLFGNAGGYVLVPPTAAGIGAIDLLSDTSVGRMPGLYRFHGEDVLYFSYCETPNARVPAAERPHPELLQSDANHNLWIMRRRR